MMNRQFQRIIVYLRPSVKSVFGVVGRNGEITACSDESRIGKVIRDFHMEEHYFADQENVYCAVPSGSAPQDAVFINDQSESAFRDASMIAAVIDLMSETGSMDEKRVQFLLDTVAGKTQAGDFYGRLKELNINAGVSYLPVIIYSRDGMNRTIYQSADSVLTDHEHDYLLTYGSRLILLKMIRDHDEKETVKNLERNIIMLNRQFEFEVYAGIGNVLDDLYHLPSAYRSAEKALICAAISDPAVYVMSAGQTGYQGMISELSAEQCREYLENQPAALEDEELVFTARKFLETDLNISETAKELYINRNTLVYRLNKIQKETGLDLRKFEDALTYQLSATVRKILKVKEG